jgi:hypothetical protein
VGPRLERWKRALEVTHVARHKRQAVDRLEAGTLKVGIVPTDLEGIERVFRSAADRIGAAMIVVGLLVSSALMAQMDHPVALIGFCLSAVLGLYMLWKIIRTQGEL